MNELRGEAKATDLEYIKDLFSTELKRFEENIVLVSTLCNKLKLSDIKMVNCEPDIEKSTGLLSDVKSQVLLLEVFNDTLRSKLLYLTEIL